MHALLCNLCIRSDKADDIFDSLTDTMSVVKSTATSTGWSVRRSVLEKAEKVARDKAEGSASLALSSPGPQSSSSYLGSSTDTDTGQNSEASILEAVVLQNASPTDTESVVYGDVSLALSEEGAHSRSSTSTSSRRSSSSNCSSSSSNGATSKGVSDVFCADLDIDSPNDDDGDDEVSQSDALLT